jgi:DNA-binding ferritin-like protein
MDSASYWFGGVITLLVIADLFFRVMDKFYWGKAEKSEFESRLSTLESTIESYKVTDVKNYNEGLKAWQEVYNRLLGDHKELTEKFDAKIADSEKANRNLALQLRKAMEKLEDDVVIATGDSPKPAMPWGDRFNQLKSMQGLMAAGMRLSGLKEARESMKIASDVMKELNRRASVVAYWSLDAFRDQENSDPDNPEDKSEDDPKGDAE